MRLTWPLTVSSDIDAAAATGLVCIAAATSMSASSSRAVSWSAPRCSATATAMSAGTRRPACTIRIVSRSSFRGASSGESHTHRRQALAAISRLCGTHRTATDLSLPQDVSGRSRRSEKPSFPVCVNANSFESAWAGLRLGQMGPALRISGTKLSGMRGARVRPTIGSVTQPRRCKLDPSPLLS